ncbi:hypothetical protein [Paraoerskovia marina]|uniref:hypothetical protein n=1 Tax=Paraoerskovia marina TaxID=545619 RepID=UPI0012DDC05A|nr:hypothetical protein [Paraoerskovia marina]
MSTTGPGRGTFLVRRLLVLAVALAVVVGVVLGVRALIADPADASPMESAEKSAPPEPATTSATVACEADDLDLALQPAAESFEAGDRPRFAVRVTHVGRQPCLVNGSQNGVAVTVADDDGAVWSSADCPVDERMLLMSPGDVDTNDVTWDLTRTDGSCEAAGSATAGDYTARVEVTDVPDATTPPVSFTLEPAPEPDPTTEPAENAEAKTEEPADDEAEGEKADKEADAETPAQDEKSGVDEPAAEESAEKS